MTKISFFRKTNGDFVGFECSGHTGYDEFGKDILCAALSGITQSIVLGLKDVCKINLLLQKKDSQGYIKVRVPKNLDDIKNSKAQILFNTFYLAVKDLLDEKSGYSNYISMEVIENVY